jgi:hypothetical protein
MPLFWRLSVLFQDLLGGGGRAFTGPLDFVFESDDFAGEPMMKPFIKGSLIRRR